MKKAGMLLSLVAIAATAVGMTSCDDKKDPTSYEIAVVTDVGSLKDGGFNEGTYNGAVEYATAHSLSYQYYQPANGADATDQDRIAAMELAIKNNAKVIVAPGFLQAAALTQVASENPDVKFVFVDGWVLTDKDNKALSNVTAITYKEQESGYLAGYAAVKEGYVKLGGCFGGGGSNPACNRYAYGYAQGINDAAKALSKNVELKISYKYGESFGASADLATQMEGWYSNGTEVVFACGGSMVNSVVSAAAKTPAAKIIGVDTDQHALSTQVLTSAQKGLAASVNKVLGQMYGNEWDSKLGGKAQNLGASDDATGLPTEGEGWRFTTFTKDEYNTLFANIKNGTITPDAIVAEDCNVQSFWTKDSFTNVTVTLEK